MSHFSVLVIGEDVEKALAPYQENNMGNCPSEFLKFTEDEGCDVDEKTGKRGYWDNPNKKWDWYVVGGRWSGLLQVKPGAESYKGRPGVMGQQADPTGVDQCRVGDLDFEAMRAAARASLSETWDAFVANLRKNGYGGSPEEVLAAWWEVLAERKSSRPKDTPLWEWIDKSERATIYRKLCGDADWFYGIPEFVTTREGLVATAKAFSTYAVIKDGQWFEKGKMGWFGLSSDEKEGDVWDREFEQLLRDLLPSTQITVVDCHI